MLFSIEALEALERAKAKNQKSTFKKGERLMNENWFTQSVVAMLCLIPAWLAIGFFSKNYQVKPEIFLVWYFLGVIVSSVFFGGSSLRVIMPSTMIVVAIVLVGLVLGAGANILLFKAVAGAPNPGLPVAIANVASVGVFFVAALLSRWAPAHFNPVKVDGWSLLGLVFTIMGASIIAIRR